MTNVERSQGCTLCVGLVVALSRALKANKLTWTESAERFPRASFALTVKIEDLSPSVHISYVSAEWEGVCVYG